MLTEFRPFSYSACRSTLARYRHFCNAWQIAVLLFWAFPLDAQDTPIQTDRKSSQPHEPLCDILPHADQLSPMVAFQVRLSPTDAKTGEIVSLSVTAEILEGWHIGVLEQDMIEDVGFPTKIDFVPSGLESIDDKFSCSGVPEKIEVGDAFGLCLAGKFTWTRKYRVKGDVASYSGKGMVRFQACNDQSCQPTKSLSFNLDKRASIPKPEPHAPTHNTSERSIGEPLELRLEPCKLTRDRPQISIGDNRLGEIA